LRDLLIDLRTQEKEDTSPRKLYGANDEYYSEEDDDNDYDEYIDD